MFLRRRVRAVGRLHRVVDCNRCAVLQLQLTAADDLLTLLKALQDGDLVAARLAQGRVYWSNKNTNIMSDVPSEAALQPNLWGLFRFAGGGK